MPKTELYTDAVIGVAIPARNARGRIARLGPVVDAILANHHYPPLLERLLAEALTLTALLGSLLKERREAGARAPASRPLDPVRTLLEVAPTPPERACM